LRSSDRKLKPPPDLFRHQNSALAQPLVEIVAVLEPTHQTSSHLL
jgi:hypothetical protein